MLEATDDGEAPKLVTTELALMQHKGVAPVGCGAGAGRTSAGPRPAIIVSRREQGGLVPRQVGHSQDGPPGSALRAGQPQGVTTDRQGGMDDRVGGDRWSGGVDEMGGLASRQETLPLADRFSELMGGAGVEGYAKKQQEGWQSLGKGADGEGGWGVRGGHTGGIAEPGSGSQGDAPVTTVSVDLGDVDALVDIMYVSNKPLSQVSRCHEPYIVAVTIIVYDR